MAPRGYKFDKTRDTEVDTLLTKYPASITQDVAQPVYVCAEHCDDIAARTISDRLVFIGVKIPTFMKSGSPRGSAKFQQAILKPRPCGTRVRPAFVQMAIPANGNEERNTRPTFFAPRLVSMRMINAT
jgi:hypothetical protein